MLMFCICYVAGVSEFVRNDAMTFRQMNSAVQRSLQCISDDSMFDDYVFSWPEHRCLLFNHLYPDIGSLLEEEFQSVLNLSTGTEVPTELDADHALRHVAISD